MPIQSNHCFAISYKCLITFLHHWVLSGSFVIWNIQSSIAEQSSIKGYLSNLNIIFVYYYLICVPGWWNISSFSYGYY